MQKSVILVMIFLGTLLMSSIALAADPQSLKFNGINSSVIIPDHSSLDVYQNQFSISIWIYPRAFDNNVLPRIIEKKSEYIAIMGDPTNSRYKKLSMELQSPTGNTVEFWSNSTLKLETWQHATFVYDGIKGTWYINGIPTGTKMLTIKGEWTGEEQSTKGSKIYLGRRTSDVSRNFYGNLDELRIYNRMLTQEEITSIYKSGRINNPSLTTNGLVVWYPFNESKGTILHDQVQNLNGNISDGKWTY